MTIHIKILKLFALSSKAGLRLIKNGLLIFRYCLKPAFDGFGREVVVKEKI